ncbi:MAG: hypothetical protein HXN40_05800 [Prevotella histicola]|nr:hypothetical protein [Prevotella histicola]MBF1408226.1 hypothetical protein [Prevotella histicola]MBF1423082.1 hypothetical protein [Prevotella histicola]
MTDCLWSGSFTGLFPSMLLQLLYHGKPEAERAVGESRLAVSAWLFV